jgi:hypothetical protein
MSDITAHGITVTLPAGWDGRISRRPAPDPDTAPPPPPQPVPSPGELGTETVAPLAESDAEATPAPRPEAEPEPEPGASDPLVHGTENPVAHLASFPLPAIRGDFGSGAVERMGPSDILVCIVEFDQEAAATPLFAREGVPRFALGDFAPHTMQRTIAGMCGAQAFFSEAGRAFCAYVVLGTNRLRAPLVAEVNRLLRTVEIAPR